MASDNIRASDHDRDAVVGALRDAYTEGRLSLEEFQERTTAAYAGRTWGDLRELTTDLPVQPALGTDLPPGALPPAAAGPPPGEHGQPAPGALPGAAGRPGLGMPYPEHPPFSGRPLYPGQLPYPYQPDPDQPTGDGQPPEPGQPPQPGQSLQPGQPGRPPQRASGLSPILPVVGMWVLFALVLRSDGGGIAFLIALVVLVVLVSAGRRGGRRR
jgi:hypothetical protein